MFTKLSNIEHFSEEDDDLPDVTIIKEPREKYTNNIQPQRLDPNVMFSQRNINSDTDLYDILLKERKLEQHLRRLEQMERNSNDSMFEQYFNRKIEKMKHKETTNPRTEFSCIEISKHIESCPVCSKLYNQKNETETVYVKEDNCEDCNKWKNWCIILGAMCIILFLIILKIYLVK